MKNLYLSALELKKSIGHLESVLYLSYCSPQFKYIRIQKNYLSIIRHFSILPNLIKIIIILSPLVNGFSANHLLSKRGGSLLDCDKKRGICRIFPVNAAFLTLKNFFQKQLICCFTSDPDSPLRSVPKAPHLSRGYPHPHRNGCYAAATV